MKKRIMHFMNKKTDFTEDNELKALNEEFFYVWEQLNRLLKRLLPRNIKYFLKFKKLYLARLFLILTMKIGLACAVIGVGIYTLDRLNIISISKAVPKVAEKLTIYLPDSDVPSIAKLSKQFNVIIFFPPDPKKDWKQYKHKVHMIESTGSDSASYRAFSTLDGVEYWGRYQLGPLARKISGLGNITFKQFSSNPEMQEGAFLEWIRFIKKLMQPEIIKYSGRFYDGVQITESGIISMTHNAGDAATKAYLARGNNPPGGTKFLKIGGYNLNLE